MATEPSHVQLVEYQKEVIPYINWMMEDIFCKYGVSIPYFLLEFDFPDYPYQPAWLDTNGYQFNINWGDWGYYLPWFNKLLGLAFDLGDLPRWQITPWDMPPWEMPDWKFPDWEFPDWEWPKWEGLDLLERRKRRRRAEQPLDWTIAGTLSAKLGTGVSAATELQSPDWTVKAELEAGVGVGIPIEVEFPLPGLTMFTEPAISPEFGDMLNERISALYDSVPAAEPAEFTTWGTPVQLTDFLDDVYTPDLDVSDDTIYYFWQNLQADGEEDYCQNTTAISDLDGTNFATTEQTTSENWKDDTKIVRSGSTLYYLWRELDNTGYYQIYTATSDLDGSNWSSARKTTNDYSKYSLRHQVVGDVIYFTWVRYVWFESGVADGELWTATMDTDGSNWSATSRRDLAISWDYTINLDFHVVGDTIYYMWNESKAYWDHEDYLYTATMGTDGSGWSATLQRTSTDHIELPTLYATDSKIHSTWLERSTNSRDQIWTASADIDQTNWSAAERTTNVTHGFDIELSVYDDVIYYIASIQDGTYQQIHTARMDTDDTGWAITKRTTSSYNKGSPQLYPTSTGIYFVWKEEDVDDVIQLWMNTLT